MIKMPSNPKRCGFKPKKARKSTWQLSKREQRKIFSPGISLMKDGESLLSWQCDILRLGRYTFERVTNSSVYFRPHYLGYARGDLIIYMIDSEDTILVQVEHNKRVLGQFVGDDWNSMMEMLFIFIAPII